MDKFQKELAWLAMKKRLDEEGRLLFPSTEELIQELTPPRWPVSDLELSLRYMIEAKQPK